jgi:hypothetical protein
VACARSNKPLEENIASYEKFLTVRLCALRNVACASVVCRVCAARACSCVRVLCGCVAVLHAVTLSRGQDKGLDDSDEDNHPDDPNDGCAAVPVCAPAGLRARASERARAILVAVACVRACNAPVPDHAFCSVCVPALLVTPNTPSIS